MISFDIIINILNNNSLITLNLIGYKIDNINVLKCLENNDTLTKLDLNKININDIENIFN